MGKRDWLDSAIPVAAMTLVMARIIYWQAKEINRVIQAHLPDDSSIDISLIEQVSPISW